MNKVKFKSVREARLAAKKVLVDYWNNDRESINKKVCKFTIEECERFFQRNNFIQTKKFSSLEEARLVIIEKLNNIWDHDHFKPFKKKFDNDVLDYSIKECKDFIELLSKTS